MVSRGRMIFTPDQKTRSKHPYQSTRVCCLGTSVQVNVVWLSQGFKLSFVSQRNRPNLMAVTSKLVLLTEVEAAV